MGFLPGEARKRARAELDQALKHIIYRLDSLESAPVPEYDLDRLRGAMAGVIGQANSRSNELADAITALEQGLQQVHKDLKEMKFAVAEGIERVARSERRIHATIKRARKELAEHGFESPGLETEAAELQLADGTASPDGKLPDMPGSVEGAPDAPSSIRGVSASTLRRVRGF